MPEPSLGFVWGYYFKRATFFIHFSPKYLKYFRLSPLTILSKPDRDKVQHYIWDLSKMNWRVLQLSLWDRSKQMLLRKCHLIKMFSHNRRNFSMQVFVKNIFNWVTTNISMTGIATAFWHTISRKGLVPVWILTSFNESLKCFTDFFYFTF